VWWLRSTLPLSSGERIVADAEVLQTFVHAARYRRLHHHGAHPSLSDENDSTFRLHLVLLVARLLLRAAKAEDALKGKEPQEFSPNN